MTQPAPSTPPPAETMVREYKGVKAFQQDVARLAPEGWTVLQQNEFRPRQGCMRILLMGFIFAFLFPPKPLIVVTYSRPVPVAPPPIEETLL